MMLVGQELVNMEKERAENWFCLLVEKIYRDALKELNVIQCMQLLSYCILVLFDD
jgi:hypothetical protein